MNISQIDEDHLSNELVTRLLFEGIEDDGRNGEVILVFGSSKAPLLRVPRAVELYKAGRAGKILLSGGKELILGDTTEAEVMKEKALDLEVEPGDILTESLSIYNTAENVLASMLILHRYIGLHNLKRLLVVTTLYQMRRCFLTLKTYMPAWIDYSLCPALDETTLPHNWWQSERGRERAVREAKKLVTYVKEGALVDWDIGSK